MIQRFSFATAMLVWLLLLSGAEAKCPAMGDHIQNGDNQFFTSNLSGRLAYLCDGPNGKTYDVLDACNESASTDRHSCTSLKTTYLPLSEQTEMPRSRPYRYVRRVLKPFVWTKSAGEILEKVVGATHRRSHNTG